MVPSATHLFMRGRVLDCWREGARPATTDLKVGHGHEDHDRRRENSQGSAGGHAGDKGSLEQHERKGDEVGNPATPIVEAVKHGDDRRWVAKQHEALTQCRQRTPSVELGCGGRSNGQERQQSQDEGNDAGHKLGSLGSC